MKKFLQISLLFAVVTAMPAMAMEEYEKMLKKLEKVEQTATPRRSQRRTTHSGGGAAEAASSSESSGYVAQQAQEIEARVQKAREARKKERARAAAKAAAKTRRALARLQNDQSDSAPAAAAPKKTAEATTQASPVAAMADRSSTTTSGAATTTTATTATAAAPAEIAEAELARTLEESKRQADLLAAERAAAKALEKRQAEALAEQVGAEAQVPAPATQATQPFQPTSQTTADTAPSATTEVEVVDSDDDVDSDELAQAVAMSLPASSATVLTDDEDSTVDYHSCEEVTSRALIVHPTANQVAPVIQTDSHEAVDTVKVNTKYGHVIVPRNAPGITPAHTSLLAESEIAAGHTSSTDLYDLSLIRKARKPAAAKVANTQTKAQRAKARAKARPVQDLQMQALQVGQARKAWFTKPRTVFGVGALLAALAAMRGDVVMPQMPAVELNFDPMGGVNQAYAHLPSLDIRALAAEFSDAYHGQNDSLATTVDTEPVYTVHSDDDDDSYNIAIIPQPAATAPMGPVSRQVPVAAPVVAPEASTALVTIPAVDAFATRHPELFENSGIERKQVLAPADAVCTDSAPLTQCPTAATNTTTTEPVAQQQDCQRRNPVAWTLFGLGNNPCVDGK